MNDQYDYLFKISVSGAKGSGKSSLIGRFLENIFPYTLDLFGDYKRKNNKVYGHAVDLTILDRGSDKNNSSMAYDGMCHAYLILVDMSDRETFNNVEKLLHSHRKYGDEDSDSIFCIVGTKSDLDQAVAPEELSARAKELGCMCKITSAKNGTGVQELFIDVSKAVLQKLDPNECVEREQEQLVALEDESSNLAKLNEIKSLGLLKIEIQKRFNRTNGSYVERGARDPQRDICLSQVNTLINRSDLGFNDMLGELKKIAKSAQDDHEENSGSRWFWCGPLMNGICGFQKAVNEIVNIFESQSNENTALLNNKQYKKY